MSEDDETTILGFNNPRPASPGPGRKPSDGHTERPTEILGNNDGGGKGNEDKTQFSHPTQAPAGGTPEEGVTRIVGGGLKGGTGPERVLPVVGWLVVVGGAGTGRSLELHAGMNKIGRSPGQSVVLDFGDEEISRDHHASVVFDPRGGKFFAQHGGGANLTYLDDDPLLQARELSGGEMLGLGSTQLKFVPFCGPDFVWDL